MKFAVCAATATMLAATLFAPGAAAIEWNFSTNGDTEGWAADIDVTSVQAIGGDLVVTAENYTGGGAPTIAMTGLSLDADADYYLYLDIERPWGDGTPVMSPADYKEMKLYFDNGSGWSETDAKYLMGHATNHGQYNAIFNLKTSAGGGGAWTGTVTGIRLGLYLWDATDKMSGKTFTINRIAIASAPEPYYWDFNEGGYEGWSLSGGPAVSITGGKMVLSGTPGLVYLTNFSWWGTGRMHFNADTDRYVRLDVSATSPSNDPKWLGFWVKDNAMAVTGETGITVVPNTGTKSIFIDLATAIPAVWSSANDVEGSLVFDTSNWAGFAGDTVSIDYIEFSNGNGDADDDCHSDAQEILDGTDPGDPLSNSGDPDLTGCGEDPPFEGLPVSGLVGLGLLAASMAAGGLALLKKRS